MLDTKHACCHAEDETLDDALSNLQQPAFVDDKQEIQVSRTVSTADSSPNIIVTDTSSSEAEEESAMEESEHIIVRHTIIRCESPLEKPVTTKEHEVLSPKLDDGGYQEASGSDEAELYLSAETFDPFDVSDGSAKDEEKLFANSVESNVRWTYISNVDGTASAHPTYSAPAAVSVDDTGLFVAKSKTAHKRRVSFDDMMQVRYFCRTQEEMLDMKKFSVMLRRQIRRRRRGNKLNLSDDSEEDLENELGWTVATKVVTKRDDDSISGIFADVVDEISDMISEVVIDAKRAHDRHQEEQAFFRELEHSEEADAGGNANAARTLQGFFESMNTTAAKDGGKLPQDTLIEDLSAAHALAQNFLQTLQNTTSLDGAAKHEEDEDDEPWFLKAMQCGGKCGEM